MVNPRLGIRKFLGWSSANTTFLQKMSLRIEPRRQPQYCSEVNRGAVLCSTSLNDSPLANYDNVKIVYSIAAATGHNKVL